MIRYGYCCILSIEYNSLTLGYVRSLKEDSKEIIVGTQPCGHRVRKQPKRNIMSHANKDLQHVHLQDDLLDVFDWEAQEKKERDDMEKALRTVDLYCKMEGTNPGTFIIKMKAIYDED